MVDQRVKDERQTLLNKTTSMRKTMERNAKFDHKQVNKQLSSQKVTN